MRNISFTFSFFFVFVHGIRALKLFSRFLNECWWRLVVIPYPSLPQHLAVKLNDNNFFVREEAVVKCCSSKWAWGFLNGIVPVPPKYLDTNNMQLNLEVSTWVRYNSCIICWIYSSLSEVKMGEIVSLSTIADIWNSLRRSYDSKTTARIMV